MNTTILIPRRKHRPPLTQRIERAIVNTYECWQNFGYYLLRGHWPRMAWRMARNTLTGR